MQSPPALTNRAALDAHRQRANRAFADFLHQVALDEVNERQIEVNRTFRRVGIVTGAPRFWAAAFPEADVIDDADMLDWPDAPYDLIIHAMALHWANDPVGQIIQCHRALTPDGLFLAVCFGGNTLSELRTALSEAEVALTGGLSPRVAPMAEIRDLGALLQRAGLNLPVADALPLTVSYAGLQELTRDLRNMGETNALAARAAGTPRELFKTAEAVYRQHFCDDGRLIATFELIFLTGWAPHDSQPKPLRPGTATNRLSEALGTQETPLKPR